MWEMEPEVRRQQEVIPWQKRILHPVKVVS